MVELLAFMIAIRGRHGRRPWMRMRQWLQMAAMAGFAGAAQAEDVVLEGVEVRSGEECLEVLGEFNWICRQFELEGWVNDFGHPYWTDSQILFYRYDLDRDSLDDAIVKIQGGGYCARGGRYSCPHLFLFGDQPVSLAPHRFDITQGGGILFASRDSVSGIVFIDFPSDFFSIEEIRENTLAARKRDLIGF
jgi:hypothetical protein